MGKAKQKGVVVSKSKAGSKGTSASASSAASSSKSKGGKLKPSAGAFYGDPLERELAAVGLRVAKITADGNCLFRAAADQTEGDEGRHADLRQRACDLMAARREEFEPFVEDDQGFDAYLKRMRKDGAWGGHMELQALSLLTGSNISIYQEGQPRWTVANHPAGAPELHLSYHGQEHYNSVRLLDDWTRGKPLPILLAAGGQTAAQIAKERATWTAADEARVAANTGCDSPALVHKALRDCGGDVDAAIERVIDIMAGGEGGEEGEAAAAVEGTAAAEESVAAAAAVAAATAEGTAAAAEGEVAPVAAAGGSAAGEAAAQEGAAPDAAAPGGEAAERQDSAAESQTRPADQTEKGTSAATGEPAGPEAPGSSSESESEQQPSISGARRKAAHKAKRGVPVGASAAAAAKKPARNKACTCGSGKKYKSCCGAAAAAAERRRRAVQEGAADAAGASLPTLLATVHI